jgi:DnaK suppressor protein
VPPGHAAPPAPKPRPGAERALPAGKPGPERDVPKKNKGARAPANGHAEEQPAAARTTNAALPDEASPGTPNQPAPRPIRPAAARSAPVSVVIDGVEIVDRGKPLPKTKLRAKELRHYKDLLLAKRRELLGDVTQLSDEALHSNRQESRGDLSNMPSHMADVGSDNWEQEFTLGLIATERALLRQIDAALERIDQGTYGVCLATHRMISPERLEAKPWAQYCIEFARLSDAGRIPPGLV